MMITMIFFLDNLFLPPSTSSFFFSIVFSRFVLSVRRIRIARNRAPYYCARKVTGETGFIIAHVYTYTERETHTNDNIRNRSLYRCCDRIRE